jgi:hypothetical protein
MTRTNIKVGLIGLILAGGLGACQTQSGGETATAAGAAGENASAAVALGFAMPVTGVSNPTNGAPAYVGWTER